MHPVTSIRLLYLVYSLVSQDLCRNVGRGIQGPPGSSEGVGHCLLGLQILPVLCFKDEHTDEGCDQADGRTERKGGRKHQHDKRECRGCGGGEEECGESGPENGGNGEKDQVKHEHGVEGQRKQERKCCDPWIGGASTQCYWEQREERREEDLKQCTTIFKAIKANIDREDVSFCRRLGEKGEKPRPLAIGLRDDREAKYLLGLAKELKDTEYKHVSIVPNMTKEQRQEEADLEREAKRRNENLTAEDKAKNLQWLVVGGKGRKRLLKGVPRETEGERTRTIPPVTGTNTTRLGDRGGARWKDNHGKQKRGRKSGSGSESDMDAGEERRRTKSRR